MRFLSDETQHEFHKLPTELQHAIERAISTIQACDYFVTCEQAESDVILRVHKDLIIGDSVPKSD